MKEFDEVLLGFFRSESGRILIADPEGHEREDQTLNDTLPQGTGLYPIIGLKNETGGLREIRIALDRMPFDTSVEDMVAFLKREREDL